MICVRFVRCFENFVRYGEEATSAKDKFVESLSKPLPVTIRIDFTKPFARTSVLPAFIKNKDWKCRMEFKDYSVWECENELYEGDKDFKKWVERECRRGAVQFQEIVSMLPVYALDIKSNHNVLDMCSAPGSKATLASQFLDQSTASPFPSLLNGPEGLIVGCDSDLNRACKVLPRNMANTRSSTTAACLLNTKKLGQLLEDVPEEKKEETDWRERFPFHKIMADVPCSGDGTIRKNMTIWTSWNRKYSYHLFSTQLKILLRGLFLLAEGEELCYSTCSLNPIENEGVVQAAIQRFNSRSGTVELVDVKDRLPLKTRHGLSTWGVPENKMFGVTYKTWEEVPEKQRFPGGMIREEMFPDPNSNIDLSKARRCFPRDNNGGGFFLAVFKKTKHIGVTNPNPDQLPTGERTKESHPRPKGDFLSFTYRHILHGENLNKDKNEEGLLFKKAEGAEGETAVQMYETIKNFYGLVDGVEDQLISQVMRDYRVQRICGVSTGLKRMLKAKGWGTTNQSEDDYQFPMSYAGNVLLERFVHDFLVEAELCRYRPTMQGAEMLASISTKRKVMLPIDLIQTLLKEDKILFLTALAREQEAEEDWGLKACMSSPERTICGGLLVGTKIGEETLWLAAAITPRLIKLFVDKNERPALLSALNEALEIVETGASCDMPESGATEASFDIDATY